MRNLRTINRLLLLLIVALLALPAVLLAGDAAPAVRAVAWIKANPVDCVVYLSFICSWFVGWTDTPDDDRAWGKAYRVIELIGGTTFKAKQLSIRQRFSGSSHFGQRFR